ncbi:hypothetical protein ACFY00_32370 [Kitasatospora sp. NPDC001540]|uniref:hypothetical protein n=1 Tax=Kitasatospora sp. NPDC001540 TaxID=3364014 RepID=UPI0036AED0FE
MNDPSYYPLVRPAPSSTIAPEAVDRAAVGAASPGAAPPGGGAPSPGVPDRVGSGTRQVS